MTTPAQIVASIIRAVPSVIPHLTPGTVAAVKASGDYSAIRLNYYILVYQSIYEYLTSDRPVTSFRNAMNRAIVEAFGAAVDLGYVEGGSELPLDDETLTWLNGQVSQEIDFANDLFARLRDEFEGDADTEATARAEGYCRTLDSLYGEAKMRGSKNIVLEFTGDDGKESCPECTAMKGKRHRVKYIIENNLIPRPGNDVYSCAGYHCEHYWHNPRTGERFDG